MTLQPEPRDGDRSGPGGVPALVAVVDPLAGPSAGAQAVNDEHQRLKAASARGVVVNVGAEVVKFGLRFLYQILIARLLLPADFGLVAMAAPAIGFVQLFADLGLTQATIQLKEISQPQLSFLFWVNLATGVLLACVCVAIAPLVAHFYGEPRVAGVMVATGGLLLIGGLFSQHQALLARHMRFRALALLDLTSFVVGAVGGIAAALLGAGYWAIIINQAVTSLTSIVIAWSATRWVPGRPARLANTRSLLHFGGNITGFNVMNFFSRNSDNILLGRFAGEQALGLYDRAFKLTLLPFTQVAVPFTKVATPLLSRSQDQPEFYRLAFRRMLEGLLLLLYPGLVFMIANSHTLVLLALGQRWAGVGPIFTLLGFDAFVAPIGYSMGWLFVSQGRTRELRNCSIPTSVIFVTAFVIGLHWGPQGVAAGYATAGLLEMCYLPRVATRVGPLRGRDLVALLIPFAVAVGVSFAVVLAAGRVLPDGLAGVGLSLLLAYGAFAGALAALPRGRDVLRDMSHQARLLLVRLRPRAAQPAPLPAPEPVL